MSLTPGTRLGVYDITAQIGAGGMGEVYRATDTNLKRQVAIKVLPASLAADADRLARFQREAEVLAALNHPHIAAIYGLEKTADFTALVMELVEGEDLSQRLARGAIPVDEALPIATQIAEALEAAHEQGIVHRDLKPANIKVRPDGTVKVLDFGLAKALDPAAPSSATPDAMNSPTITTPAMTQAGMILGTAAYMSPEQAKGRRVDKRADIWAFGVVLCEMLTGARLFGGEDTAEVLAAVVRMDPDLSGVPVQVRRLLRKCLEKDPKRRLRDMGDWQALLEEPAAAAPPAPGPTSGAARTLGVVAALATLLLAAVSLLHFREGPASLPLTRMTSLLPPSGAVWNVTSQALSPDGRRLAFAATGEDGPSRIWLRSLDTMLAQPLAGTEGGDEPFWSPDGNSIAFFAEGKLNRIDLAGGAVLTLADGVFVSRGGTWGADGIILYAAGSTSPLTRIQSTGGPRAAATELRPDESSHRYPWFLPDGRHYLFAEGTPGRGSLMDVWLGSLDGTDRQKILTDVNSAAVFAAASDGGGDLLYLRESTLVAQPFDARALRTTGEAVPVAERVRVAGTARGAFTVSDTGVLAFADQQGDDDLAWLDKGGRAIGSLRDLDGVGGTDFSLSPDGRVLAHEFRGNIWLYDVERGVRTRFTTGAGQDGVPLWSPDSRTIYFASVREGKAGLYRKPASGVGAEEAIAPGVSVNVRSPGAVSPDGKLLAFIAPPDLDGAFVGGRRRDTKSFAPTAAEIVGRKIWILPDPSGPPGASRPYQLFPEGDRDYGPAWSPDGRWLAFGANDTGDAEVYIAPFPGPGPRVRVSRAGGGDSVKRFSADGKQLLFVSGGRLVAVDIAVGGGQLQVGEPRALFPLTSPFEVSPDGRVLGSPATSPPLTIVQNWVAADRRPR